MENELEEIISMVEYELNIICFLYYVLYNKRARRELERLQYSIKNFRTKIEHDNKAKTIFIQVRSKNQIKRKTLENFIREELLKFEYVLEKIINPESFQEFEKNINWILAQKKPVENTLRYIEKEKIFKDYSVYFSVINRVIEKVNYFYVRR